MYDRRTPPAPADLVDRLQFIRGAQRLGLRLAEIGHLLAVRDTGVCAQPAELLRRRHLDQIDSEMRRLSQLRADLVGMLAHMPGPACPDPAPAPGAHRRSRTGDVRHRREEVTDHGLVLVLRGARPRLRL